MYNYNAINTLADINTIPRGYIAKLCDVLEEVISNAVYEAKLAGETEVACDVGIGTIFISWDTNNNIQYSFSPRQEMENNNIKVITENQNPLMTSLEDNLTKKIMSKYKELI